MIIFISIAAPIVALLLLAFLLYYFALPKFIVKKMRGGDNSDGAMTFPDGYEEMSQKTTVIKDLKYPSSYPSNEYDLYLPKMSDGKSVPLMIWVHGGGFISGNKDGGSNVMTALCANGYAVASINYAVAPEYKYPTALRQIHEFTAHLTEIEKNYPTVDMSKLIYAGDSAGAQLAAQYVAAISNPQLAAEMKLNQCIDSSKIKAAVLVCGPFNMPALRDYAKVHNKKLKLLVDIWGRAYYGGIRWHHSAKAQQSIISKHITSAFPPTFLTDGNTGSFEVQNRKLAAALKERGIKTEELYFDEAQHGKVQHEYLFKLDLPISVDAIKQIDAFLQKNM